MATPVVCGAKGSPDYRKKVSKMSGPNKAYELYYDARELSTLEVSLKGINANGASLNSVYVCHGSVVERSNLTWQGQCPHAPTCERNTMDPGN